MEATSTQHSVVSFPLPLSLSLPIYLSLSFALLLFQLFVKKTFM